jgi:hypothetical protein
MTGRQPLDVREWLQDMRRFNGRDADRATELLAMMDRVDSGEFDEDGFIERIMELSGNQTVDTTELVAADVKTLKDLRFWAERNPTFKEFGALDQDGLNCFVQAYEAKEAITDALHDLMVEAGLLNANDYTTDPLPLLRMFLPVD